MTLNDFKRVLHLIWFFITKRIFYIKFYLNIIRNIIAMSDYNIVRVKQGDLRGRADFDFMGNKFYSYRGVPYAEPPIGRLRFKAPRSKLPWQGVKDAFEYGTSCRSRDFLNPATFIGSEDCLFLNIYAPKDGGEKKPVMVYVHGGGFMCGSATGDLYGPKFLLSEGVVLVTLNYRLGAFGFLAFTDPSIECPGNNGMKDVLEGLKWVKKNIHVFNGDPNNVTLFGESAGSAIVHYMTLAPSAKDYFHKIICQSGTANADWACDVSRPHQLAEELGFKSSNSRDVYEFLLTVSMEDIAEAQEKLVTLGDLREGVTAVWCPTIEVICENEPNLITEHPFCTLHNGNYNDVPSIMGYNKDEGLLFLSLIGPAGLFLNPEFTDNEVTVPRSVHLTRGSALSKDTGEIIKQFYYGDSIPSSENVKPFIELMTDIVFSIATHYAVKNNAEHCKNPVYYYRFSVDSPLSMLKTIFAVNHPGVAHADDLAYLFDNILSPLQFDQHSLEYQTMYRMVKMWTQFAKTSNPNVEDDKLLNIKWEPANINELHCLNIGEELTFGVNPDIKRIEFWEELVNRFMDNFIEYVKNANSVNTNNM